MAANPQCCQCSSALPVGTGGCVKKVLPPLSQQNPRALLARGMQWEHVLLSLRSVGDGGAFWMRVVLFFVFEESKHLPLRKS